MKAILLPADAEATVVDQNGLDDLERLVGGCVETLPVPGRADVTAYIDGDGKYSRAPNQRATLLLRDSLGAGDWIAGPCLITGYDWKESVILALPEDLLASARENGVAGMLGALAPEDRLTAEIGACPDCLRRSWLLALLGPYIEKMATSAPGSRSPELLRLSNEELVAAAAPKVAGQLLARIEALGEEELEAQLDAAGCWACCRHGDLYPVGLRDAADAPWALIGRGDPRLLDGVEPFGAVTIVGARRATSYGREVARDLGRELAAAGLVVVSGLAFGIDACAHRGAQDGAGRTIAVLGCGPDVAYPAAHRSLWRRISETDLVISELPPGATPWRWTFPARNRIMAALAGMTVVVEAAARSGSLITADLAADLGRDLGAVPGPVNSRASAGPNNLLAGGACLVRDAQDVLDALLGPGVRRLDRRGSALDPILGTVLAAVESGAATCDVVATALDLPGPAAAAALARLELHGYLSCSTMGVYTRTTQALPSCTKEEA